MHEQSSRGTSFWLRDAPLEGLVPVTPQPPQETDVVIVGAGLTGASAAYHLASTHGTHVVVLDQRSQVSGGATGRNGGHLVPDISVSGDSDCGTFEVAAVEALSEFVWAQGIDCDLEAGGHVDLDWASEEAPTAADWPPRPVPSPLQEWDPDTVKTKMRSRAGVFGRGIFNPRARQMWPAKLVNAIARLAIATGLVKFVPSAKVTLLSPSPEDPSATVVTVASTTSVTARRGVIVATNGWTADVLPALRRVIVPVKNQVVATRPILPVIWTHAFSVGGSGAHEIYCLQRRDGRIILGGSRALAPNEARGDSNDGGEGSESIEGSAVLNCDVSARLRAFLPDTFPDLFPAENDALVEYEWAGILGCTIDGNPLVGRLAPELANGAINVFVGAGYNGHGMPYCFAVGQWLAASLAGVEPPEYLRYLARLDPTAPGRELQF